MARPGVERGATWQTPSEISLERGSGAAQGLCVCVGVCVCDTAVCDTGVQVCVCVSVCDRDVC